MADQHAESVAHEERWDWLIGAVVTRIAFNPDGSPAVIWVKKKEVRAKLTLTPVLLAEAEHSDGLAESGETLSSEQFDGGGADD